MENRFGVKDFVLFSFLVILLVVVVLAMKQYDRQWDKLQSIEAKLADQQRDIRDMQGSLTNGIVVNNSSTTKSSAFDPNDPFAPIKRAEAIPGYAKGDWLVEAFGNGIAKLTPLLSVDIYATEVQDHVIETLATRDNQTVQWIPLLASKWETSDDGLVFTFTMRDGTKFSDGEPVTAEDVVFTYQLIMNEAIAAPRDRSYLERIKSVEREGTNQVVFTFKEPYFEAFTQAASLPVLPKHFYSRFKPEVFNNSVGLLMGSGPYRMEDPEKWKPGQLIELVRNDRYWGTQPAFDRIVFREITNDVAHQKAYTNGEIDLFDQMFPLPYRDLLKQSAVMERSNHYEYVWVRGGYRFIAWNQVRDGKPTRFADKRVRQALTMLIDRERMIQEIQLGYAVLATGPFSPLSKQSDPSIKPWPYDVERAKKLLAEAGFTKTNGEGILLGPDDAPFEFKLTYPSGNANYERMAISLKDGYARAGIRLKPDPIEWASFTDLLNNKNFEAVTLGWSANIESDINQEFHSSQMVAGGDDFMSYKSPELDATITEARRTVDENKRMELWRKCHRILAEDQPYTFLWFTKRLDFVDKRLQNIHIETLGRNPFEEWFVPRTQQKWSK